MRVGDGPRVLGTPGVEWTAEIVGIEKGICDRYRYLDNLLKSWPAFCATSQCHEVSPHSNECCACQSDG